MPRILYRFILGDLVRLIGLTAVVLVTVIAFGATLKPLAGDAMLDAQQTAKYLGLVIVPMLQFALPFAAGFGATLALHRMTSDNEILAMAASGISYRRILLPVAALGLCLTVIMVLLTQWVIPRFWTIIEQLVAKDITKMFQASIERGEPFKLKDLQIYASDIVVEEQPAGPGGPETRMHLIEVAAAELDEQGRVTRDVTAARAIVDVYRREGQTFLKLVMSDTVAYNAAAGDLAYAPTVAPNAIAVPNPLRDNPKWMTRDELMALRKNPDQFLKVIQAKQVLASIIREMQTREAIDQQLRDNGNVELIVFSNDQGPARGYAVYADRLQGRQFVSRDGRPIQIVQFEGDTPIRRFTSSMVELAPVGGAAGGAGGTTAGASPGITGGGSLSSPAFDLVLGEYDVIDLRQGSAVNRRDGLLIPELHLATLPAEDLSLLPSQQLIEIASSMQQPSARVQRAINAVLHEIQALQWQITSRLSARYALSATAFLLLMLGATLAMTLRNSLPLTIYLWAFLPSVLNLVLISAGDQLLRDGYLGGVAVMWSGNAVMVVLIVSAYVKLARN